MPKPSILKDSDKIGGLGADVGGVAPFKDEAFDGSNACRKCVFVSLSGAPNVGKSSILNAILGTKVAATSYRPQTTRNSIRGIFTKGDTQVVFVDTPGFFKPKEDLEKKIVKTAVQTMHDCDFVLVVVDPKKGVDKPVRLLLERCQELGKEAVVVINKMDTIKRSLALPVAQESAEYKAVRDVLFVSAKTKDGIDKLTNYTLGLAKEDAWYYDPSHSTDKDILFVAAEITREKLFLNLRQEIPYGLNVRTLDIHKEGDLVVIFQQIETHKESHKGIIIGPKGSMLKNISKLAVEDLEKTIGQRVKLNLSVVVRDWSGDWESF